VAHGYVVPFHANLHGFPLCDFLSTDFAIEGVSANHLERVLILTFLYCRTCGKERALSTHIIMLTATDWICTAHFVTQRKLDRRAALLPAFFPAQSSAGAVAQVPTHHFRKML
jgi:hypothetical protein